MFSTVKYALRSLSKAPGFTATTILTLALGVGATLAIFSVVNAVLLKPLPFTQPERLARIYTTLVDVPGSELDLKRLPSNIPEYLDMQEGTTAWESIEGWTDSPLNIASSAEPGRAMGSSVTGGFFAMLGVTPESGRLITAQDAQPGAPKVAVISHGLWQRLLGGERDVLGSEILLNGVKHTIVGILPQSFRSPLGFGAVDLSEVWTALQTDPPTPGPGWRRGSHGLNLLGRLKPDVTLSQAQAQMDSLVEHAQAGGESGDRLDPKSHGIMVQGMHQEIVRGIRPALHMLLGAVCFLLLIACVNVANLLLARAEGRQQEIAVRCSLGAGLWRLAHQFVTEGLLLAMMGVTLGLLLARAALELIRFLGETDISLVGTIGIDGHVLLFAVAMCVTTGLIFGLVPLMHVMRGSLHGVMKSAAASTTSTAGAQRFRQALVVSQLALALVLLTGTGLMLQAFWRIQQINAGFDPKSVITMVVALPQADDAAHGILARLEECLTGLPGIERVAFAATLPPASAAFARAVGTEIKGYVPTPGGPKEFPQGSGRYTIDFYNVVSPEYPNTLRISLVEGRFFDERDTAQAPRVAVINQTVARTFWGNRSAIGHRIQSFGEERVVIGVMGDVKNNGLENPTGTEIYLPWAQAPFNPGFMSLAIRTQGESTGIVTAARRELREIDPTLSITKVRSMDVLVSVAQLRPRFLTLLLTVFAAVALVLAAIGIYGLISYSVAQRTREFGIRMALGARHGIVLGLVLKRGLLLTACGVAAGLAGAFALTRFLSRFLFGITATDPATFIAVSLLLAAIAIFASYIPARRATKIDPLVALRAE